MYDVTVNDKLFPKSTANKDGFKKQFANLAMTKDILVQCQEDSITLKLFAQGIYASDP